MTNTIPHSRANRDYQADFAKRLIDAVGFEAAIRECYENQWLGTLVYIQHMQRKFRR